jgi:heme/copper-type cytochrome/quinol oxidase subunit 1
MRFWWLVLGLVLVVSGGAVAVSARSSGDFGWFAYTPDSGSVGFEDGVVIWSSQRLWGLAIIALGSLLLTAGVAYRAGLRRGRA